MKSRNAFPERAVSDERTQDKRVSLRIIRVFAAAGGEELQRRVVREEGVN